MICYKILPGKPKLAGLPASYVKSDKEAETLEVTLVDETIGAQLILSYTIYNERPVITRNARLVNTSNQELRIEKIASMQLDLTKHDYDVISVPWLTRTPMNFREMLWECSLSTQVITSLPWKKIRSTRFA